MSKLVRRISGPLFHFSAVTRILLKLVLITTAVGLSVDSARAQLVCPVGQVTTDAVGDSEEPSINEDGTRIAFSSDADIGGGNPEGNAEIFLFDVSTSTFIQITDNLTGDSFSPVVNGDGTRVAFVSTADINGGNPLGNDEIYLFDTDTQIFTQITDGAPTGDNFAPSISRDGTRIAFSAEANVTAEIFLFDTATGILTQITNSVLEDFAPSISGDGTRIAFVSNDDIGGGNPDGNLEIFLFDTDTSTFAQITDTQSGDSFAPSISGNGTRIAFSSTSNITGGNPEGNLEVFLFDTAAAAFTQITDALSGSSDLPSINRSGTRIAFQSDANIDGGNPEGNLEVFLFDTGTGEFTQITDTAAATSGLPSLDGNGSRIAFQSDADIDGENPDGGFEIFLALCSAVVNGQGDGGCALSGGTAAGESLAAGAAILLLPLAAVMGIGIVRRRRKPV